MVTLSAKRDWRAYTFAQVQEVGLFDSLLVDLVEALREPRLKRRGRPTIPLPTLAFCAVKKAHTGYSSRRNHGHILDAEQEGFIETAPGYNAANAFLNSPTAAGHLRRLVQLSAVPLAGIEESFAVDSTGFACGTYGSYRDFRYGEVRKRSWVKLHACVGVRFNIVADALATPMHGAGTGDVSNFAPLLDNVAKAFHVGEVSADKAYSSRANHDAAAGVGAQAFIPFKRDATGKRFGSFAWVKAYHYFCLYQEAFYARYHKRSNVEATFGALKQTLGENLKSKTPVAQRNEVLCKVIAWNLRCVVRAMNEVGIEPVFDSDSAARLFRATGH
jgi:hypothetical protein